MRSTSKTLTTVGVIAAVIAIGIFLGWLASRPPAAPPPLAVGSTPTITSMVRTNAPLISHNPTQPADSSIETVPVVPVTDTNVITDWEDKVDEILRDDSEVDAKARKMLALFPRMTVEGQIETAQHISNLLDDKDYPAFGRFLANPKTDTGVLDVLMMDVLNRPNSMKMPLLLEVAFDPDHPKAAEAKETLALYLEEDYGTNQAQWREKVAEWLKENPD